MSQWLDGSHLSETISTLNRDRIHIQRIVPLFVEPPILLTSKGKILRDIIASFVPENAVFETVRLHTVVDVEASVVVSNLVKDGAKIGVVIDSRGVVLE